MNQDRWKTINQIFLAALEAEPDERRSLVDAASNGDVEIRREVEALLSADAEVGSYFASPPISGGPFSVQEPQLVVGSVLCARFRILREIAEGGMGKVYEAFDNELSVRIALKVIHPRIASNPEIISRFRQEVRLQRSITHPNICRIFDLERASLPAGEVLFLTMEYLAGETLANRLECDGPLSVKETFAFAHQICDALDAAHARGIIHRDMKPANIMLVPEDSAHGDQKRAVITDFGLARLDPLFLHATAMHENNSLVSQIGHPIGTLGYMAPEQLEGTPVSGAADIYAFALILFEMLNGEPLFKSNNLLNSIAERVGASRPSLDAYRSKLPRPWRSAIEAGLSINPEKRPRTASELLGIVASSPFSLPSLSYNNKSQRYLAKHRATPVVLLILIAIMSLFVLVFRLTVPKANSVVAPGTLIYLTEVKNLTGEPPLNAITELLRAGLAQSTQVNLLEQGRIGDILQQMRNKPELEPDQTTAREIAMRAGAARIVFGSLTKANNLYHLDIEIQQTDNTPKRYRSHWTTRLTWNSTEATPSGAMSSELLLNIRSASNWIRNKVGESSNDLARLDSPPEDVTTASWDALADFSYAEKLSLQHKRAEAVVALKSATLKDPQFALAYSRMGDILINMGHRAEGYDAYRKAMDAKSIERLSLRERDRIKGIYAQDIGDYQASEDAFRDYSIYYEHDYSGWFYRALPLVMLGRTNEALDVLRKAHQVSPERMGAIGLLARYSMLKSNNDEARSWIKELAKRQENDEILILLGCLYFLEARYSDVINSFVRLSQSQIPVFRAGGFAGQAELLAERGQFDKAIQILSQGIELVPEDTLLVLDRGALHCRAGDMALGLQDFDRVLAVDSSPATLLTIARALGRNRTFSPAFEPSRLRAYLRALLLRLPVDSSATDVVLSRASIQGEMFLLSKRPKQALIEFRKADAVEAPIRSREYIARALLENAEEEANRVSARDMLRQAEQVYSTVALRPQLIWYQPRSYPPGFYADQLEGWLRLARITNQNQDDVKTAAQRLAQLRLATR